VAAVLRASSNDEGQTDCESSTVTIICIECALLKQLNSRNNDLKG
jgi:hypothetical protein